MRQVMKGLICFVVFAATGWWSEKTSGQARAAPLTSIGGRITVVETINHTVAARTLPNLTVYLFDLDQSKPLQQLQHKCRRTTAKPGGGDATAFAAYNFCVDCLGQAVELVPYLNSAGATRTDGDGYYKFEDVPPARWYQVVVVKVEDGEPIVIVGLTPKLKPAQRVTIDLRENDPWTNADPL
jgi:hypothetical protein